jgi:PAS domain S-box-containing protein
MVKRVGRLLVVDDERMMRELCRHSLASEGHEVTVVESGPAALEIFRPGEFDLVLTDLMMPGMSGLDLLAGVLEVDPEVACVMMTAQATVETAVEAIKRGAFNYVSKPFTPGELVALVGKALEVRWLTQESARLREEAGRNLLLLTAEQSRIRTIVESMVDGVMVINREGKLVLFNPALLRLLGIKGELPTTGESPSESLFPEQLLGWMKEASAEADTSRVARELSGGPPNLAANIALIRDEAGEALGVVAVVRDITEAKNLQQRMSDFVSMVAHELRSPLGAISQYLDVILSGATKGQPDKEQQILGRCRGRTGALSQLVGDLLEFARLQGKRKARERTLAPLEVAEVLRETVDFASQPAAARKVTLTLDLPQALPQVDADRDDLLRLFTNFVDNAIKYNREGGSVRIAGHVTDGYVVVEVIDTGLGIAQDQLARLGEAFFRVKTPETAQITGTGLGVSICKEIIEAHNGHLEVESEEGQGSTFRVLLPRRGLATAAGSAPTEAEP